jgi:hypothetical protein
MKTRNSIGFLVTVLLVGCASTDAGSFQAIEGEDPDDPSFVGGKADGPDRSWPANGPLPALCDLDRPLQVFFAPDDPTTTLELSLIRKVADASRAAGNTAPEGANPYRIRYAVYNLTHDAIALALADAEAAGVDVQVLIEADQLGNEWVRCDDLFLGRGLEVVYDHHALDDATRTTADMIGIAEDGLMHLKTRLFEMPGWSAVLSGSLNPNASAGVNEENLHLVREPSVVARYAEGYRAVLESRPQVNRWDDAAAVNLLYSPAGSGDRISTHLLQWLDEEDERILLMVFSLRDITSPAYPRSLVDILKAKAAAGVPVYVITDRKQSDGVDVAGNREFTDDPTDDRLRAAGIQVFEAINDAKQWFPDPYAFAAVHHKTAILGRDRLRVVTDAGNWTAAALGSRKWPEKNVESVLFIDSSRLDDGWIGRRYLGQWVRVLTRYAGQGVERGENPDWPAVLGDLVAGGWPTGGVSFSATVASTSEGEGVFVAGDLDALGAWGTRGPGVALSTTAEAFPVWSADAAVPLPLGQQFLWKLTIRAGDSVRYEAGGDR